MENNDLIQYNYLYDICMDKISKLLHDNLMNEEFQNRTFLPKEYEIDNLPIKNINCVNDKFQLLKLKDDE